MKFPTSRILDWCFMTPTALKPTIMPTFFSLPLRGISLVVLSLAFAACSGTNRLVATIDRPNKLRIERAEIEAFSRVHYGLEISVVRMKIVKTENAYYLLAGTENGITYAFELESRHRKSYLSPSRMLHACSDPELSLGTFLQKDGHIKGCRNAVHTLVPPVLRPD